MIAVRTNIVAADLPDSLDALHAQIDRAVPSGIGPRGGHKHPLPDALSWYSHHPKPDNTKEGGLYSLLKQLGTLGSGNHFVEVDLDETGRVWVVIHSGSRGIGNKLASAHIKIAKQLCYLIDLEDKDLAFFLQGTQEFDAYIQDMLWAQEYAYANREIMMDVVLNQLERVVYPLRAGATVPIRPGPIEVQRINCHHNFTQREHVDGELLWITRKGAIQAGRDQLGVVPGSMATGSYITKGLGNSLSYNSSSHGAGRLMSRTRARKELSVDELREQMQGKSWNYDQAKALLDEAPGAYKDLAQVMADQADLCVPIYRLRTILNYKGT